MSTVPSNQLYKKQNQRLIRSTFKKGIINAVHVSSSTVDVAYAENPQNVVRNIPVASVVDITTVMVGQRCRVDLFDENNPSDCVLAYTY